jgi:tRNA(Ile)-lysidine synthase
VDEVHAALARFLRRHAVGRATPLLAAVSGGGDSLALLHALLALGQRVDACHVHHGLRGAEADGDLGFVRERARSLGVRCFASHVDATRDARGGRAGESPEGRARRLRYGELERVRAGEGYGWVVTAHSLDDQAETLLLRATRGTGPAGLAGIAPRDAERRLLRPLLEVRRSELRNYLKVRGLDWREDTTNADRSMPRNRLRAEVLPVLEELNPRALERLAALADASRATERWLAEEVESRLADLVRAGDGGLWLDRSALLAEPVPLRRRLLLALLRRFALGDRSTQRHLLRLESFLRVPDRPDAANGRGARGGRRLSLPRGMTLVLQGRSAWLGPAAQWRGGARRARRSAHAARVARR